jgi:hypothetical protein
MPTSSYLHFTFGIMPTIEQHKTNSEKDKYTMRLLKVLMLVTVICQLTGCIYTDGRGYHHWGWHHRDEAAVVVHT